MTALDVSLVDIVLVRPARSANVALACRAMKAMGLTRLCLVGEPADAKAPEARALAYGAWDILDGAEHFESLSEAVRASVLVAGTSGRVFEGEVFSPRRLAEEGGARSGAGRASIVFGPEASGLSREELASCHLTVHVPTHEDQPSLNLAQAVLVVAYELRLANLGRSRPPTPRGADDEEGAASAGELEAALADFRSAALGIGYFNPQNPDRLLAEWRRLLARAGPTRREVTLLRGLARQMAFAAGAIARAPRGAG
ncbi:MAG TPA: TrmH family RNA methyltransferase [Vicinamibacteria bacterium]|nr:TrmH family RNA methyltransferase [Vicinamibacteria bacterium]